MELEAHARKTDPEVAIEEVTLPNDYISSWREIVQPYHFILYVSQDGEIEELRTLNIVCKEEKKTLLPAICFQQYGLAGPMGYADSKECWESVWHRLHKPLLYKEQQMSAFSPIAGAILANVIVFEFFKEVTGISTSEQNNRFFLLDLDKLEGIWHTFISHPFVEGSAVAEWIKDCELKIDQRSHSGKENGLFLLFNHLTSTKAGIFHIWDEGELKQLPLSQCRVQAVNPLSEGPAELLPEIVCGGLTHEEARREAGLIGVETYASQTVDRLVTTLPPYQESESSVVNIKEFIGVGSGETFAEGICRGLQKCLAEELRNQYVQQRISVSRVELNAVEDKRCQFYLQALTTMNREPMIALGENVSGFPVVWVGTNEGWYGVAGLNITMALQKALQQALMKAQNETPYPTTQALEASSVFLEETAQLSIGIPSCEEITASELMQSAMQVLQRNCKRILVFELVLEPILKEELAGVFGVLLRKEEPC